MSLPILEHDMSCFYLGLLNFFQQCLVLLSIGIEHIFLNLYLSILCSSFQATVNIFFCKLLLLVYRTTIHFCVLTFYPVTLINSLTSFISCFAVSVVLSVETIMLAAIRNSCTSFFSKCNNFYQLFMTHCIVRTPSRVLKCERRQP